MINYRFETTDILGQTGLEWLVTNGIGGYASGTVSGVLTRRYHGWLVAALKPPVGRMNLIAKFDEWVQSEGSAHLLAGNHWTGAQEQIDPRRGIESLRRFYLDGSIPTWEYAADGWALQKSIWMKQGENTTLVWYQNSSENAEIKLTLKGMLGCTDFHQTNRSGEPYQIDAVDGGVKVSGAEGDACQYFVLAKGAEFKPQSVWLRRFYLAREAYRGLDDQADYFNGVDIIKVLGPGEEILLTLTAEAQHDLAATPGAAFQAAKRREADLVEKAGFDIAPDWIDQLVLAADQFIVSRKVGESEGHSVIAGYHWFSDWGRDSMISLPGLTLATGRFEVAESILRTFANFLSKGMLPNRFPDLGEVPEYNTIDATLWYFDAVYWYFRIVHKNAPDKALKLVADLYPQLEEIIQFHEAGTRHNIHVDPDDGLLYGGEEGVQLTWMDAKVEGHVVTPRIGKPVEINALWYSALMVMAELAAILGKDPENYREKAARVRTSFEEFWQADRQYCYDVIDGPAGNDPALRPNQVLAMAAAFSPLSEEQMRLILSACEEKLLTPVGLRSLSPDDDKYIGHYGGGIWERDTAYHQGTVWGWLLGPYCIAQHEVYRDKEKTLGLIEQYAQILKFHGVGSISEIFDGDPPFEPRGCVAQAWSVAAALWAYFRCFLVEDF